MAFGPSGDAWSVAAPSIELPRGGGAIRGLGETFSATVTGGAALSISFDVPAGRAGFTPGLSLSYSSSSGTGPYGLGWDLSLDLVRLRTESGVPSYDGDDEVMLSGTRLVRARDDHGQVQQLTRAVHGTVFAITTYRPQVEAAYARIERWADTVDSANVRWRVITGANVTTWYGNDAESRVFDPADPRRITRWLPCLSYDDRGNAIRYRYRSEDSTGVDPRAVHEAPRTALMRTANRYLRLVSYGNRTPYLPAPGAAADPSPEPDDWLFHLVLDYGDHDDADPGLDPDTDWPVRPDPSSDHRAGFEIRTYRRCRRALVFHAFAELGPAPVLVRSTRLDYDGDDQEVVSLLTQVTRTGHAENGATADLPAIRFSYVSPQLSGHIEPVDLAQLVGSPVGIDGTDYEWVDLDGDGAPGILARRQGVWYYKRNLGPLADAQPGTPRARFAAAVPVVDLPAGLPHLTSEPKAGQVTHPPALVDVDGDGRVDLLLLDGIAPGAALRSGASWQPYRPFPTAARLAAVGDDPARGHQDTSRTLVDLTGDGSLDLLLADGLAPRWHPGRGVEGFAAARPTHIDAPSDSGVDDPLLLHADQHRAVLLADLDGDGLADLVEVSRTVVSYRPNLGHGRFGGRVVMDTSPVLDAIDCFDPSRVLLADVDGTGPVDLIYLASDQTRLYRNRSGNSWSPATVLRGVPAPDQLTRAAVVDLFGCGTGALVWSTAAPAPDGLVMHYLDLATSGKPYLLSSYENGFGCSVSLGYTPSTAYGLRDALDGSPWPSRLPFPVQCLSEVVTHDAIRDTTVTATRSYHLGRYEGADRQFMGFGRIDERDTQAFVDGPENLPPVLVRRWFHTGAAFAEEAAVLHTARRQYADVQAPVLPEPDLPADLDADGLRWATRALAGLELRSETYAEDGSELAGIPYLVTERTVELRLLQPGGAEPRARPGRSTREPPVFQVIPAGEVSYQTERDLADPRVSQSVVLDTDDRGRVLLAASITHPRRIDDASLPATVRAAQQVLTVTISAQELTVDITGADRHRLGVPWRTRSYQLTGIDVPAGTAAVAADLRTGFGAATDLDPGATVPGGLFRRLLGESRRTFLTDDLGAALPVGQQAAHGLPRESHQLALTAALAGDWLGPSIDDAALLDAGYVHLAGEDGWWLPSGHMEYAADAREHFLQPVRMVDAMGGTTTVERLHDLLVTGVTNARGHRSEADYDLRALEVSQITDVNGNRSACRFDPLGCVVASATMGQDGAGEGDTLDDPTVRLSYSLNRWRDAGLPAVVRVEAREQHGAANPRWQESRTYFDGGGGVLATKAQASPGLASHWDEATAAVTEVDTTPAPRWVGTGRTVLNNKGLPIRQYEPYFSDTAECDRAATLVQAGVSDLVRYDPLGRREQVERPDGTFARVEITPWRIISHDAVDTVLDSLWYAERGSPDPAGAEPTDTQTRAAWVAARNAATPSIGYLDTLGRVVLAQSDNGEADSRTARVESDLTRLRSVVFDTRERGVVATWSDLTGQPVVSDSAERGRTVTLVDALGQQVLSVDRLGRRYTVDYDDLHRPVGVRASTGVGAPTLLSWLRYGDDLPAAAARNAVGRPVQTYDGAGRIDVAGYDLIGAPTSVGRRYVSSRSGLPDWAAVAAAADPDLVAETLLDAEVWQGRSTHDALGRATRVELPDDTVLTPVYDIGNRLVTLDVQPGGAGPVIRVIEAQESDAAGRPVMRRLGSGVLTTFVYDALSRRLDRQLTVAPVGGPLQDLGYGYDPVGNVTSVDDAAQQTRFFANAVVSPSRTFTYDALYQLTRATGRELAALGMPDANDAPAQSLPHANDLQAVRSYAQEFSYDDLGNVTQVRHLADGNGWRRRYRYAYELNAADPTNQLSATNAPGDADGIFSQAYGYDDLGNLVTLPQVTSLDWDVLGRLGGADLGGGGSASYSYGAAGGRVRKVVEQGGLLVETLYLGTTEITREWSAGGLRRERRKVRLGVDGATAARLDRVTVDNGAPASSTVLRYLHHDHLGSATLVTNESGDVVGYEEYHPYGSTAYRSAAASEDVSLRRYRFLSRERDEETGFYHLGARAYAPWLGRWISPDPAGYVDGLNLYRYAKNNPATLADPSGLQPVEWIVPSTVTTPEGFETWARGAGVQYSGTPTYDPQTKVWGVESFTRVEPGAGGSAQPLNPTTPPVSGQYGSVAPQNQQPPAQYGTPGVPGTRLTENEHVMPGQQLRDLTTNPRTGQSDYGDSQYGRDATVRVERDMALNKTHGNRGGPNADNPTTTRLRNQPGGVSYREDIFERSRQNAIRAAGATGSAVTEEAINRGILEQEGNLFNTFRGGVSNSLPSQTTGERFRESVSNTYRRVVFTMEGTNRFSEFGGAAARAFVPGFVEAEMAAVAAPYVVSSLGITNAAVNTAAAAAAAAPAATATTVLASAAGGYLVGDIVESAVTPGYGRTAGVAAGTASGAVAGAAIGAVLGSILPGPGTVAGAVIGGVVGGIAGFIGSFW